MLKNTKNTNHISLLNLTEITKSNSKPPLLLNSHGSHLKVAPKTVGTQNTKKNKYFNVKVKDAKLLNNKAVEKKKMDNALIVSDHNSCLKPELLFVANSP
jgi:hypothetical protein